MQVGGDIQLSGLTKLILECLWSLQAEVLEEDEVWSEEILDIVESRVRERLPMVAGSQRKQLIFDMVFKRAFSDAKEVCLALAQLSSLRDGGGLAGAYLAQNGYAS